MQRTSGLSVLLHAAQEAADARQGASVQGVVASVLSRDQETGLVQQARNGNRQAFQVLARACADPLYNLALRMTGNQAEAEDMVQESFLRAFGALHTFDGSRRFFSWLYAICLNQLRDKHRKKKNAPARLPYETIEDLPDQGRSPEKRLQDSQSREALLQAVQRLPLAQREALVLRFFQELPFASVAEILEISENAAKKRVYQALTRLHEMLEHEENSLRTDQKRPQGGRT